MADSYKNIYVASREKAEELLNTPMAPMITVISITDKGAPNLETPRTPESQVIRVSFADAESGPDAIQYKDAEFIASRLSAECQILLVQCEYGESRSVGIAGAIRDYFHDTCRDNHYEGNALCYRYMLKALQMRFGWINGHRPNEWEVACL